MSRQRHQQNASEKHKLETNRIFVRQKCYLPNKKKNDEEKKKHAKCTQQSEENEQKSQEKKTVKK